MTTPVRTKLDAFFNRLERFRSAFAVLAMLMLTEAVYMRPGILLGTESLGGSDYEMLHRWRLGFARQELFGVGHALPGWNPHEVLGTPFAANLQSFPWIPTRLVLLLLDPSVAYGAGIAMAAALAAIFTWLYCRRAGLSRIGAAAAGWTFACAGYFSSRIMAGHLPLLEAYPAIPLLLWLVDRTLAPERWRRHRLDLVVLALCCTCVVAAGHPQVPAYALGSALLYVFWKGRGVARMLRVRVAGSMVFGIGLALAIWWPMLLLIGRSTRILRLAAPDNDISMPYGRLLALVIPGIQGWASPMDLADRDPFFGYPNNAYFWDTASYIGILPLVAIVALLVVCIVGKRMPDWKWRFLTCLGVGAFICSLPLASPLLHALPGTLLRSPARMLYISTFCAAVALGAGVDTLRGLGGPRWAWATNVLLGALLVLHFGDLARFDKGFVKTYPRDDDAPFQALFSRELDDGRIAAARDAAIFPYGDLYDDAGGFDSVFLARFNRAWLALAGEPPDTNEQLFDASILPVRALEAFGVRFVITPETRADLKLVTSTDANLYRVANPAPRADFFAADQVEFAEEQQIPALFAAGSWNRLLLALDAEKYLRPGGAHGSGAADDPAKVDYSRPSSDEIVVQATSARPGFIHVLESWDPGWTATLDGAKAPVIPANGFAMAVPVLSGSHSLLLQYETPGRSLGVGLSLLSLGLLVAVAWSAKPQPNT